MKLQASIHIYVASTPKHCKQLQADVETKHDLPREKPCVSLTMMHASLAETVVPGHSKRTDFPLMPTTTALLIIDIQEYLSKPSTPQEGEQYLHHTALPRVVSNLQKLASLVREKRDMQAQGCEVIFTFLEAKTKDRRDVSLDYKLSGPKLASLPNSATCPATFLPGLTPRTKDGKGDIRLPKTSCSVFVSTNLHYMLKNLHVEQLVITGQLTDQCI
jgi:ureidoacrylate peracid hydrolase